MADTTTQKSTSGSQSMADAAIDFLTEPLGIGLAAGGIGALAIMYVVFTN